MREFETIIINNSNTILLIWTWLIYQLIHSLLVALLGIRTIDPSFPALHLFITRFDEVILICLTLLLLLTFSRSLWTCFSTVVLPFRFSEFLHCELWFLSVFWHLNNFIYCLEKLTKEKQRKLLDLKFFMGKWILGSTLVLAPSQYSALAKRHSDSFKIAMSKTKGHYCMWTVLNLFFSKLLAVEYWLSLRVVALVVEF